MKVQYTNDEVASSDYAEMYKSVKNITPDGLIVLPLGLAVKGSPLYTSNRFVTQEYVVIGEWAIEYDKAKDIALFRKWHFSCHAYTSIKGAVLVSDLLAEWKEDMERKAVRSVPLSERSGRYALDENRSIIIQVQLDERGYTRSIVWEGLE